jgi:hypothetical protein
MNSPDRTPAFPKNKRTLSGRRAAREVLLISVSTIMAPEKKGRLSALLSGNVDWEYLLALATFQGVGPLLYHGISANNLGGQVPGPWMERLQSLYNQVLYRNVIFSAELTNILNAFNKHGIASICLKGVVMAEALYENLALRTIADMDILVRPEERTKAGSLLNEMGYKQSTDLGGVSHPFHGAPYYRPGQLPFFVELHWDLEDNRLVSIPHEAIWERARALQLPWGQTRALSIEDALLFSAMQLFKQSDQLKILGDIAITLKKYEPELDWNYITNTARSWGIGNIVYYALRKAKDHLDAPVPASAITGLRPGIWRRWAIAFLSSRTDFLSAIKSYRLKNELGTLVRSLMMSELKRTLWILEKYRDKGKQERWSWFKTAAWIVLVTVWAAGRNVAGIISGGK